MTTPLAQANNRQNDKQVALNQGILQQNPLKIDCDS
jgi:hypothetical protein